MPGTAPSNVSYMNDRGAYVNVAGDQMVAGGGIQPIGGGPPVELIKGLSGMIQSNGAILQELKEQSNQLRVLNQRTVRMFGSASGGGPQMSQAAMTDAVAAGTAQAIVTVAATVMQAVQGMQAAEGGGAGVGGLLGGMGGGGGASGYVGPVPPVGGGANAGGGSPSSHGRAGMPEGREPMSPYEQFQRGRSYNVGMLRQDLAQHVTRRLSESQWAGEQLTETMPGSGQYQRPDGSVVPAAVAAQYLRRSRILGSVTGALGEMGEGGSLAAGAAKLMPRAAMLAGKFAGVAGLAMQAGSFAENQRAENMKFQSVMGGSNAAGFVERGRQRLFGLSQFGGMGGEQGRELYMGVTEAGLRGGSRDRALDFASDAYRRFGMSVQESVALVKIAADQGATSFSFLTQSLNQVTQAAKNAGVNAQVARAQFTAGVQSNIPVMGLTNAAASAASRTTANMGYGRAIGSTIDTSGMTGDPQLMMQARMAGVPLNTYLADINDPTNPRKALDMQDKSMSAAAKRLLGPLGERMVADAVRAKGGPLTPAEFEALGRRYQREGGRFNALIGPRMVETLTGVGGLTPANVIPTLMTALAGGSTQGTASGAAAYDKQQAETGTFQTGGGPLSGAERARATAGLGLTDGRGFFEGMTSGARWMEGLENVSRMASIGGYQPTGQETAAKTYMQGVEKTGRAGGISQKLASEAGFAGDRRIRVKVAGGGERLVTTQEALKYFRDQVDKGEAIIESGADAGKSLAEAMGMAGDANLQTTSDKNEKFKNKGKAVGEGKGGSKVEITMSPELQRWFRTNPPGGTNPYTGLAPPNSRTTPNGLSTDSSRG